MGIDEKCNVFLSELCSNHCSLSVIEPEHDFPWGHCIANDSPPAPALLCPSDLETDTFDKHRVFRPHPKYVPQTPLSPLWKRCDDHDLECDTGHVEKYSEKFVELLKTVVLHLLNNALHDVYKKNCYGCQVDHPSQKQHQCIWPLPRTYLRNHFEETTKHLWNGRFSMSVSDFLSAHGVHGTAGRVSGAAEIFLNELKYCDDIVDKFDRSYERISGDWFQNATLDAALQTWRCLYHKKD